MTDGIEPSTDASLRVESSAPTHIGVLEAKHQPYWGGSGRTITGACPRRNDLYLATIPGQAQRIWMAAGFECCQ